VDRNPLKTYEEINQKRQKRTDFGSVRNFCLEVVKLKVESLKDVYTVVANRTEICSAQKYSMWPTDGAS